MERRVKPLLPVNDKGTVENLVVGDIWKVFRRNDCVYDGANFALDYATVSFNRIPKRYPELLNTVWYINWCKCVRRTI